MIITKLKQHIEEMKNLAEILIPYTPPKYPKDDDISWFKSRDIIVDGIPIIAHYSIIDYGDLKPIVLTIGAKNSPFLPFGLVCKIARMFLGNENLSLFEYTKEGSKIYSWMVLFQEGIAVKNSQIENAEHENYNGFDYFRVDTNNEQNAFM